MMAPAPRMEGETLARLREGLGLDLEQLSRLLNDTEAVRGSSYRPERITQWENGSRPVPKHIAAFVETLAHEQGIASLSQTRELLEELAGPALPGPGPGDAPPPPPLGGEGIEAQLPMLARGGQYASICTDLWGTVALAVTSIGAISGSQTLQRDGRIIDADKEALGQAWGKLAETNETFRKLITQTMAGGAWLEIALVTGTTATKLLNNHQQAAEAERLRVAEERARDDAGLRAA